MTSLEEEKLNNMHTSSDIDDLMIGFQKVVAENLNDVVKNEETIKLRKRVGDLDLEDSDCDPKKCLISDWLIFLFVLFFIAINAAIFSIKTTKMS